MALKEILGSVSPLYGAISGEGLVGKMLNPSKAADIAAKAQEEEEEKKAKAMAEKMRKNKAMASRRMAKGGGVESKGKTKGKTVKMAKGGYVRKADGVAQRGKTKGRFV